MFSQHAGSDPVDQLNFMADEGFRAFEDNGMKGRKVETQEAMARTMADRDIQMGVFVAHTIFWREPNLASGRDDWRDQFLSEIEESVDVAKRVNATWMTVVPGHIDLRKDMGYQSANVVETLRRASDILEPHGLVMVLEPLNPRDHPGLFLTKMAQAYDICRAVDSPSCKILNDLYHQQITEGNLIPNIDAAWDEIAYFQMGDNPGRKEPTTGEINYLNVFKHIHSKGFTGVMGMEHGNSQSGKDGERAVIDAYRAVDAF
jgi:hydroxypyruvate isomerase